MKRRTTGPLALLITLASAQLLAAQMLAAPGPSGVAPLGSMPYPPPGYGAGVAAPVRIRCRRPFMHNLTVRLPRCSWPVVLPANRRRADGQKVR